MDSGIRFFIVVIVLFLGQFPLQYFLSTRESRWLGYLLPVVNILSGVLWALNAMTLPAAVAGFLLGGGIVCAIHVLIYCIGRDKVRRQMTDRVDKMNIQDLG